MLTRNGVAHTVLNAKEHAREAEIIKDAGLKGAVTIATNMAGRGVDIKIDDEVRELGGLYVLGTERHESRRIDNQLRGRSGRQGDPGETRFYLSGQDDLVRLFAGDRIFNIMERFKVPDDQPMEAKILSNQIEGAQKKVEEQNFVSRKNVLKYDDVMNVQRQVIYAQRREVLEGKDMSDDVLDWIDEVIARTVGAYTDAEYGEEWDLDELVNQLHALYGTDDHARRAARGRSTSPTATRSIAEFQEDARDVYVEKQESFGANPDTDAPLLRDVERYVILQIVDRRWREHLENMEYLREGIHLRSMAQKDPLTEYRHEGHIMFEELGQHIREEVVLTLFHAELGARGAAGGHGPADGRRRQRRPPVRARDGAGRRGDRRCGRPRRRPPRPARRRPSAAGAARSRPRRRRRSGPDGEKLGRNDPCWCGSGKKFKKCHGA